MMTNRTIARRPRTLVSRRTFLEGLAAGGVLAALGHVPRASHATGIVPSAELAGSDFDLTIGLRAVNFTGKPAAATVVNGSLPAPVLRWREGDTVTLRVRNELDETASIHWHGIVLPANMDGVPGLSFHGIPPGGSYTYRFPVRQSGTYWYHSHSGFQEQTGLYGPLIIDPREPAPFAYDREHVVLLSDWTDRDPDDLYRLLKRRSDYFNFNKPTLRDLVQQGKRDGFQAALQERLQWGRMRMQPSDFADVSGYTYTYLMNGVTPAGNWTGLFRPGERVRLRLINGSAMTVFDVRIPGLRMTVVAADGQNVHPVTVDELRISVAEVYDLLVEPAGADAFTIFAQSLDRSGYARGTLAVRPGLTAPVPELDKIVYLTMADMGHGTHGAAAGASGERVAHGAAAHTPQDTSAAEHAAHGTEAAPADLHAAHGATVTGPVPHGGTQTHPASESNNPYVDMQTRNPSPRLADPGIGLRGNGRRVLTYADLRTLSGDPDGRPVERTIELHLTGHMERYMWSFDGIPFSSSQPIELQYGERLRLVLVNDTMMEHPIHLHGMWSDLEDEAGEFLVRKHTVSIPPGTKRAFRVTADALGRWAFHCHLAYHMEGMFREVVVRE